MKIKHLDGLRGLEMMNDFPVEVNVTPDCINHKLIINIKIAKEAYEEDITLIEQIFSVFSEACDLGLCSGSNINPEICKVNEFRIENPSKEIISCYIDLTGVDYRAFRVMIRMLRGEFFINGLISSLSLQTVVDSIDEKIVRFTNEKYIGIIGLYNQFDSFKLIKEIEGRRRKDRLVQINFFAQPSTTNVKNLIRIQNAWQGICKGGFSPDDEPAYEYGIITEEGYLVSPRKFEIPIEGFDNPELCFDSLLNGLQKFSAYKHPIKDVHIY